MLQQATKILCDSVDYFVGDVYKVDTEPCYKARLLTGCILTFILLLVVLGGYYISIDTLTAEAILYYYIFAFPIIVFMSWMLFMLKKGKNFSFSAHSIIFISFFALFSGVLVTGGPATTEILPMMVIPVFLAFMMLGHRYGLLWAVVVGGLNYLLVALDYFGVQFMNVAPPEAAQQLRVFNWTYFFVTTIFLVMIYDSMNRRLSAEKNAERERFRYMAMHDSLTGLPNRKYFDEVLETVLALADRSKNTIAIGLLDINKFKAVNDEVGHEAGDIVLQVVADRLSNALRKSDKVAHLGGDEFALILNNVKTADDITSVSNKMLDAVAEPIQLDIDGTSHITVSCSIGLALYPTDTDDENELRSFSDKAVDCAKKTQVGWCMYSQLPEVVAEREAILKDAADDFIV